MSARGQLFIVSAPSGAGKSSLIAEVLSKHGKDGLLRLSVSHTTRAPRPGEVDHVNYHFVSDSEFEAMVARGAFYEHARVFDHRYGTSRELVQEWRDAGVDVLLDIDWQGARQVRAHSPEALSIFILPPSIEELGRRLTDRAQDSAGEIAARMRRARAEISHYDEYDYLLINDDFQSCSDELFTRLKEDVISRIDMSRDV